MARAAAMFPDNTFDLVMLFDIIEHLETPFWLLKEIQRTLRTDGKLIITTPNLNAVDKFLRTILGKEKTWYGFLDDTHLNLFTPLSLRFLVVKAGFEIVRSETPFHSLPRRLQKIAGKTGLGGQIWLIGTKLTGKFQTVHVATART
jgi:SAM-dependent methyltransferase